MQAALPHPPWVCITSTCPLSLLGYKALTAKGLEVHKILKMPDP